MRAQREGSQKEHCKPERTLARIHKCRNLDWSPSPQNCEKAISENKLNVAFTPAIESFEFELGKDLVIKATVELKPEIKLGQFKDVEVEYAEFKNEENALERELEMTQKRFSTLNKVDRPSTDKDSVTFDFEGFVGRKN